MLRVVNWESYQHYKDRNPPWIKLSTSTFQDYEFSCLQDASKLLAICIWTLASRYKDPKAGLVPNDLSYIKSQCNLGGMISQKHLNELIEQGFLERDSKMLASCKQNATTETEAEAYSKETEKRHNIVNSQFEEFWDLYPRKIARETANKKFKEVLKNGAKPEEIIRGVEEYANYCKIKRTEKTYILHASTWLHNKRWQDDYTGEIAQKPSSGSNQVSHAGTDYAAASAEILAERRLQGLE